MHHASSLRLSDTRCRHPSAVFAACNQRLTFHLTNLSITNSQSCVSRQVFRGTRTGDQFHFWSGSSRHQGGGKQKVTSRSYSRCRGSNRVPRGLGGAKELRDVRVVPPKRRRERNASYGRHTCGETTARGILLGPLLVISTLTLPRMSTLGVP